MSGVFIKQKLTKDGKVDIQRMLKELKFKMKSSKALKDHIDSLFYEKPSDKKRKKRKSNKQML